MRGSPLIRVLFVFAVLALALIPLRHLTRAESEAKPDVTSKVEVDATSVHLALTSTSVPFHFEIKHLGKIIWQDDATTAEVDRDVTLHFPEEGIELVVNAKWRDDSHESALRVRITHDNETPMEQTLWGRGLADDVLIFKKP